jgi:hypothetical protein
MSTARALLNRIRTFKANRALPTQAREAAATDRKGLPPADPGAQRVIDEGLAWLGRAQDHSASADGGFARHFSLVTGWSASYPETTGYIIPTLIEDAAATGSQDLRERARRGLDWLTKIQLQSGAFQGGVIGASPVTPVVFNTGQIVMGLAAGETAFGSCGEALRRAADWLVAVQDEDGCWRKGASPFTAPGEKVYDTHVAWGLIEAARVLPDAGYGKAALANIRWALTHQRSNGWFANCCLTQPGQPLTHTIGYALRGIIEGYRFSGEPDLLAAARRTADGLLGAVAPDGRVGGRLDPDWRSTVDWACLTGSSQIAHCWLLLFEITGEQRYLEIAHRINAWVRRTIATDGSPDCRGGVKGSFPVDGGYGTYEYLNWACKFTIDANRLELRLSPRN